jgi:hypothetical protein
MTRDDARRIAVDVAKLPELLRKDLDQPQGALFAFRATSKLQERQRQGQSTPPTQQLALLVLSDPIRR